MTQHPLFRKQFQKKSQVAFTGSFGCSPFDAAEFREKLKERVEQVNNRIAEQGREEALGWNEESGAFEEEVMEGEDGDVGENSVQQDTISKSPEIMEQQLGDSPQEMLQQSEPKTVQTEFCKISAKTMVPQQENTKQTTEQQQQQQQGNESENGVKNKLVPRTKNTAKAHSHEFNTLNTTTIIKLLPKKEQNMLKVLIIPYLFMRKNTSSTIKCFYSIL